MTDDQSSSWLDFKRIKAEADFDLVLAHYGVKVTAKGDERLGRCPFHEDKRASLHVNVGKGVFHCFGCRAKGNALDFVAKKEGVGIREAAAVVARLCGIDDVGEGEDRPEKETAPAGAVTPAEAHETEASESTEYTADEQDGGSEGTIPAGKAGVSEAKASKPAANPALSFKLKLDPEHPYLDQRGLSSETIAEFGLGFCGKGLLAGRIAIPLHDERGSLVAYLGRWVGDEDELLEGEGKYKLPPKEKFRKDLVLFNLHRVPAEARRVVLVEGAFSVFHLWETGHQNVVALLGSSCSKGQRQLLAERFDEVQLLLDGDEAGRKASATLAGELSRDLWVRTLVCPDGKQPDDLSARELNALLG